MKEFTSVDDILEFAIGLEQDAVNFYKELAKNALTPDMQQVFEKFAREEIEHKARLTKIKEQGLYQMTPEAVNDLK
jgi:rubrerythrin